MVTNRCEQPRTLLPGRAIRSDPAASDAVGGSPRKLVAVPGAAADAGRLPAGLEAGLQPTRCPPARSRAASRQSSRPRTGARSGARGRSRPASLPVPPIRPPARRSRAPSQPAKPSPPANRPNGANHPRSPKTPSPLVGKGWGDGSPRTDSEARSPARDPLPSTALRSPKNFGPRQACASTRPYCSVIKILSVNESMQPIALPAPHPGCESSADTA
jgi:hypothetical protein